MRAATFAPSPGQVTPLALKFADDGAVPNNPRFPLLVYRGAINLEGASDPADVIEKAFLAHGWGDSWRNGIYDFPHYHAMIHEVLGIAKGRARVRFGGSAGEEIEVVAGDVAVLPAGTGHQRISASKDLMVVGAYPEFGTYDLCRGDRKADHARAVTTIPEVPLPDADPVYGAGGPLLRLWSL